MFGLTRMVSLRNFEKSVKKAVKEDTDTAASTVLSLIQTGFSVYDLLSLVGRGSTADVCRPGFFGADLRILPLGASITRGLRSTDGNGYCKALRDQLHFKDFEVNMIGSRANGTMVDNDFEAKFVNTVMNVTDAAANLPYGEKKDMANTLTILSTLLPSLDTNTSRNVPNHERRGINIVLADLNPVEAQPDHGWINLPGDFDPDGTHPNNGGYRKLVMMWYDAIEKANSNGLIPLPAPVDYLDKGVCEKKPGDGIWAGNPTQAGSGEDDGIYFNDSESTVNIVNTANSDETNNDHSDRIFFARIYGRDVDDMVVWTNETGSVLDMDVHDNCNAAGVHWVDINSDGLDNFICIRLDRNAFASPQAQVCVGDVDGDGRADYCVLEKNGDMSCWRNRWIDDIPKYWQPLRKCFTGKGMGNLSGVRLEDINSDGRADWLWVDDDGATTAYTNSRSCNTGKEGDGLNVVWRQGFQKGASSGPTHPGIEGQDDPVRDNIHFARIFGSSQDFGMYDFFVFKNVGSSATKIKADGNQYCNIMGHNDGWMDYIWILSKGDMRLYPNKGLSVEGFSRGGQSFWGPNKVIFDPKAEFGRNLGRRDLHLADIDSGKACDIIWTDPDNNNRMHIWKNRPVYAEKHGIGLFDRPVYMADITGNRKADYLRADMIHTNKFTGDGNVWYNRGERNTGGSSFHWDRVGKAYSGSVAGSCTYFPDLNGDGTADMHSITDSLRNTATTY
ncbi:hypothetical protein BDW75DRAFT_248901 [Aspergillus navahoensis]